MGRAHLCVQLTSLLSLIAGTAGQLTHVGSIDKTIFIRIEWVYRTRSRGSPLCPVCEEEDETISHFLFKCPAYARQRAALYYECGPSASSLSALLNNPRLRTPLFSYIHATRRFTQRLGILKFSKRTAHPDRKQRRRE